MNFLAILILIYLGSVELLGANKLTEHVKVGVSIPKLSFTTENEGADSKAPTHHTIQYEPKTPTVGFIGYSYRGLSASLSQDMGSGDEDTTYSDYRFGLNNSFIGLEVGYSEFARFHINQGSGFNFELPESEKRRLDMEVLLATARLFIFPIRFGFDLGRAFEPAKQKKSGLGLGFLLNYTDLTISTKKGFIPESWQGPFGNDGEFSSGNLKGNGVHLAIGAVLAPGDFFLSALISAGPGKQTFKYKAGNSERSGNGSSSDTNIKVSGGYSGKRFFLTGEYRREAPSFILKHMTLTATRVETQLVAGYKW